MTDPHSSSRLKARRRHRLIAIGAIFSVLVLTRPVFADDLDVARAQKEALRAQAVETAERLRTLNAQGDELRQGLDELDRAIEVQRSKVDAAEQALADAEDQTIKAQVALRNTEQRLSQARVLSTNAVLDAYMGAAAGADSAEVWFEAADIGEAVQKQQLLGVVRGRLSQQLDALRVLSQDQDRARRYAERAQADATRWTKELAVARSELQNNRAIQADLEAQLRGEISDWAAKRDSLVAAEAEIDDIIRRKTAEIAGRRVPRPAPVVVQATANVGAVSSSANSSGSGYIWPADGPLTSNFGYRRHPITGGVRLHAGLDIGADYGQPIWASNAGEVIFAGWNGGYGNCVMIDHYDGVVTLYGHQSEIAVSEGETVGRGTLIGYVGSTGASTGPHLHFETRVNGNPSDPLDFLP